MTYCVYLIMLTVYRCARQSKNRTKKGANVTLCSAPISLWYRTHQMPGAWLSPSQNNVFELGSEQVDRED